MVPGPADSSPVILGLTLQESGKVIDSLIPDTVAAIVHAPYIRRYFTGTDHCADTLFEDGSRLAEWKNAALTIPKVSNASLYFQGMGKK